MISLVDITFHANTEYADTDELIRAQRVSLLYVDAASDRLEIEVIKHLADDATRIYSTPRYRFFRGHNGFFRIPFGTLRYLRQKKPDVVLIRGIGFPLQLIAMRWALGSKVKILVKHHADKTGKGIKRVIQRLADRYVDRYFFVSLENAAEWLKAGIIQRSQKILEQPANLTEFQPFDKSASRAQLALKEGPVFLWVGRLNENKDPWTVIKAFAALLETVPDAQLHLVYKTAELLPELARFLQQHATLQRAVVLHGCIAHEQLPVFYNAADYFISSSHAEGGSVAIQEAMACGCLPVVSRIPASMKTIAEGKYGFYFSPGTMQHCTVQCWRRYPQIAFLLPPT
jgi:glycosyltransferase involved in cell wall biosynthesis